MASMQDLDARQRMINMMYMIFIAMLALNMSKEVLQAFGDVNSSLKTNIEQTESRNSKLMAGLATKAVDQPEKYAPLKQNADQLAAATNELTGFIDKLKSDLVKGMERDENGNYVYYKMDRDTQVNEALFANDKLTPRAKEFTAKVDHFREVALASTNDPIIQESIKEKFSTEPINVSKNIKQNWLRYNFERYPLIASLTKMTNIEANARQTQSQILSTMVSGQLQSDVSMTNYKAIVIPDKTAFFTGEHFTGKVVLGRYDKSLNFDKATINGHPAKHMEAGQVLLDFPTGSVGQHDIKGTLYFKEGDSIVSLDFNSSYAVIPKPNSAVISADKMNVVYRGVKNPLTITIPGATGVSANAPGMSHGSGTHYTIDPTNIKAHEVSIKVSGRIPGGQTVTDSKTFRIKEIPKPDGTIRGQSSSSGAIKMQRRGLKISTIGANIPNFDFDLQLAVTQFTLQVPGKPVVEVHGTKLNDRAIRMIEQAKRGALVQIYNIKAHIVGNSSYHMPPPRPILIQLTN